MLVPPPIVDLNFPITPSLLSSSLFPIGAPFASAAAAAAAALCCWQSRRRTQPPNIVMLGSFAAARESLARRPRVERQEMGVKVANEICAAAAAAAAAAQREATKQCSSYAHNTHTHTRDDDALRNFCHSKKNETQRDSNGARGLHRGCSDD